MELRRSPRVASEFFVAIEGIDSSPRRRRGNISVTGLYFEAESYDGVPDSVQTLRIAARNDDEPLALMARVARVSPLLTGSDEPAGVGLAFEFMPESSRTWRELEKLVRAILSAQLDSEIEIVVDHRFEASVGRGGHPAEGAQVHQLSVHRMQLDTNWAMAVGEVVQVQIHSQSTSRAIPVAGTVTRVDVDPTSPRGQIFHIEVAIQQRASSEPGSSGAISDIISWPPDTGSLSASDHLTGALSRIQLTSLLSFLELERMSGELQLRREEQSATIYLRDGQVVDADARKEGADPRSVMADLMQWSTGTFDFVVHPVTREDRIRTSTTALLLDLAREQDESKA